MAPYERSAVSYRYVPSQHPTTRGSPGRTMNRAAPLLLINPLGDTDFVRTCDEAMRAVPARPEDLQALLRARYPAAVVRPRSLSGERLPIWYVYRDGRWVSSA